MLSICSSLFIWSMLVRISVEVYTIELTFLEPGLPTTVPLYSKHANKIKNIFLPSIVCDDFDVTNK